MSLSDGGSELWVLFVFGLGMWEFDWISILIRDTIRSAASSSVA